MSGLSTTSIWGFFNILKQFFNHLGFGTTKTQTLPNPHFLSCFSPNTLKTSLSLLILRLHFHLSHQNIQFKHITDIQRSCQLSVGAISQLDENCFPNHCTNSYITFHIPSTYPSYKIFEQQNIWDNDIICLRNLNFKKIYKFTISFWGNSDYYMSKLNELNPSSLNFLIRQFLYKWGSGTVTLLSIILHHIKGSFYVIKYCYVFSIYLSFKPIFILCNL